MFLTIKLCTELFSIEQIIYIKIDLALNNLQRLICHKTQQTKPKIHKEAFIKCTHTHTHTHTRARACVRVYIYIYIHI